jgi:hypothetical protein
MNRMITSSGLVLLCVCLAGCGNQPNGAAAAKQLTPDQQKARTQLASIMAQAAQTAQSYKAMDNAALLSRLAEQSTMKKESFNSPAYRELRGRTDVDPAALVAQVKKSPNADGLLPLLLLREQNQKAYQGLPAEMRAAVLTDALQKSTRFNSWGVPGVYLEDASRAMLETGKSTVPALRGMLKDTRPAPVFWSQTPAAQYNYRVCDYALFFLEQIQGNKDLKMPVAVADRDALIQGIK